MLDVFMHSKSQIVLYVKLYYNDIWLKKQNVAVKNMEQTNKEESNHSMVFQVAPCHNSITAMRKNEHSPWEHQHRC
jgi:hypothetical protein